MSSESLRDYRYCITNSTDVIIIIKKQSTYLSTASVAFSIAQSIASLVSNFKSSGLGKSADFPSLALFSLAALETDGNFYSRVPLEERLMYQLLFTYILIHDREGQQLEPPHMDYVHIPCQYNHRRILYTIKICPLFIYIYIYLIKRY